MSTPSVIKVRARGGRYRAYYRRGSVGDEVDCAGCGQSFDSLDVLKIHIPTCKDHPLYVPLSPRGETPEQILSRLAARLNCEPRQVADRVLGMLEERKRE